MRLIKPGLSTRAGLCDLRDAITGFLWVDGELKPNLANLPRECLIARRRFLLDSSRRDEVLTERSWFDIMGDKGGYV